MLGIVASRNGRSRNGRVRNGRSRIGRSWIGTSSDSWVRASEDISSKVVQAALPNRIEMFEAYHVMSYYLMSFGVDNTMSPVFGPGPLGVSSHRLGEVTACWLYNFCNEENIKFYMTF